MGYRVVIRKKALKNIAKMPVAIQRKMKMLVNDLMLNGPILPMWPNFSKLSRDEYHCHLSPKEAAPLVRSCDLLLAPSWEQEGFGLPVLESFASGVPVVASDIAAFRGFAAPAAALVPALDPVAFSSAARKILRDPTRWRNHRRAGLRVADRYSSSRAATSAESALRWVASGQWRHD